MAALLKHQSKKNTDWVCPEQKIEQGVYMLHLPRLHKCKRNNQPDCCPSLLHATACSGSPHNATHSASVIQVPTLFSADIPNGFSVTTTLSFIKKNELIDLVESVWLEDLHRPVRNSESGGKPCNYKLISDTAGFVLAPLGRGQRWAVALLCAGCLLLASNVIHSASVHTSGCASWSIECITTLWWN